MGHVRALLSLKDEDTMRSLARQAIAQGWSVRKMEQMVREASEKKEKPAHSADPMDNVFVKEACRQMEDFFQSSVKIKTNSIQIYYENEQDLTRILEKLDLIEKE